MADQAGNRNPEPVVVPIRVLERNPNDSSSHHVRPYEFGCTIDSPNADQACLAMLRSSRAEPMPWRSLDDMSERSVSVHSLFATAASRSSSWRSSGARRSAGATVSKSSSAAFNRRVTWAELAPVWRISSKASRTYPSHVMCET